MVIENKIIKAILDIEVDVETKFLDLETFELQKIGQTLSGLDDDINGILAERNPVRPIIREDLHKAVKTINEETDNLLTDALITEAQHKARREAVHDLLQLL